MSRLDLLREQAQRLRRKADAQIDDSLAFVTAELTSLSARAREAGRLHTASMLSLAALKLARPSDPHDSKDQARLDLEVSYCMLANEAGEKGRHARAITYSERLLALNQLNALERLPVCVELAEILVVLGNLCRETSQSRRAARYFSRLADIKAADGNQEEELEARSAMLENLLTFSLEKNEPKLFFQLADDSARVAELASELGEAGRLAQALHHQGFALVRAGARGDRVVEILQAALQAQEDLPDGGNEFNRARLQTLLGQVFLDRDEAARGLPLLRTAISYQGPEECPGFCFREALRTLDDSLRDLGDFLAAEKYLRSGILRCEKEASPYDVEFKARLALAFASKGDLPTAVEMGEEALSGAEDLTRRQPGVNSSRILSAVLPLVAQLHLSHTRNYSKAIQFTYRSIEVGRETDGTQEAAACLFNLGAALLSDGGTENVATAAKAFDDCLRVCDEMAAMRLEGQAHHSLGRAHLLLGERERAIAHYEKSAEIFRACGDPRGAVQSFEALAAIPELSPGMIANYLRKAAEIGYRTGDPSAEAHALWELARVREAVGLHEEAAEHHRRGIEIVESARARLSSTVDRAALMRAHGNLYADAALVALRRNEGGRAFQYVEAGRARLSLDRRAEIADGLVADPDLRRRRQELAAEISARALQLEEGGAEWLRQDSAGADAGSAIAASQHATEAALHDLEDEWEQLESTLGAENPRFAARVSAGLDAVWTIPRVQEELLGPRSVLLEYLVSDEHCLIFAITAENFRVFQVEVSNSTLTRMVNELRHALVEVEPGYPHGHALYEILLAPAAEMLVDKEEVLICPHGPLHNLPYAVLLREDPSAGDEPYFADRWANLPYFLQEGMHIHYVASATTEGMIRAAEGSESPAYREQLLALAAPLASKNGPVNPQLPPLRFAQEELHAVSSHFAGNGVRVVPANSEDSPPTKEEAMQLLDEGADCYRFVHFATHALLDNRSPWLSALLFEPAEGAPMPGYLRANEAIDLELPAQCVTMSGCHTLGSADGTGEGMVGLALAFRYAGARSVCASLWQVADESTAKLMARFYDSLCRGATPPAALADAQRQLVGEAYHPRHWAAFGLFG